MNALRSLLATLDKEWRLLRRDRAGLLVLFLMPAVLVVIMMMVQENVLRTTGDTGLTVVVVNRDTGDMARRLLDGLGTGSSFTVITEIDGASATEAGARGLLARGVAQFGVVVPEGLAAAVEKRALGQVGGAFGKAGPEAPPSLDPSLTLLFDPLVKAAFRVAVQNALERMLLEMEMEVKARVFAEVVPRRADGIFRAVIGPATPARLFPEMNADWGRQRIVGVTTGMVTAGGKTSLPTPAQQSVPAYALFGMFFIVVPLAGGMVRERRSGVMTRLLTAPASGAVLMAGKVAAYLMVCAAQFGLILLMGKFLPPFLGTPALDVGESSVAVALVVMAAGLAASGFGVLLGAVARTYEQVSTVGPLSVVIAAAIGGIMVPVYVMPPVMRDLSRISPLAWGLDALTDLFVRGAVLADVMPDVGRLLGFAGLCFLAAWGGYRRR